MHFNLHNEYRLSPDLDQFGDFSYAETSEVSTYRHPDIHYKMDLMYVTTEGQVYPAVKRINHLSAGNAHNSYEDLEFMMKSMKMFAEKYPEKLEENPDIVELGVEALFPKWMNMSKMDFVNIKTGDCDGTNIGLEFDEKYMSLYQHESSYHSLSASEEYEDYENEMKQVMEEIESIGGQDPEKQNWSTIEAFQHLDSHRYEMKAQKDMPLMDLERPMNSM